MTPNAQPLIFLATPLHDGRVHHAYMEGVLQVAGAFPEQLIISKVTGTNLPVSRDILTATFLRSPATHLLCVDSDIGWSGADLQHLLQAGKDFVSGNYARKHPDRALVAPLRKEREGDLAEAQYAAAGFLLLTRSCVEQMVAAHPELRYETPKGEAWALWSPIFDILPYGEDVSFSMRWRALGGKVWVHSLVTLRHYGDSLFMPAPSVEVR
jgi:hypothetical protein